jgi:tRNA(fMet)-specific endonuclease VapC
MSEGLRFMLDTDTISYAIRGVGAVAKQLLSHAPSEICLSSLSLAELRYGAEKRKSRRLHQLIDAFVGPLGVVPFDDSAAREFGRLAAVLADRGTPIGSIDTLIAAHAVALGVTLVTNNTRHFSRVRGLSTANWC